MSLSKRFLALLAIALLAAGFQTAVADDSSETCMVNGDKFSEHTNKPTFVSYKGETYKLCCHKCEKKFKKNPEKYVKELNDAKKPH